VCADHPRPSGTHKALQVPGLQLEENEAVEGAR
jgi:hypothetical protein